MSVATYEDVAVVLRRPIIDPDEQAQVAWWLSGVEIIIGSRLGDLALLDQAALRYIEAEAVAAKVQRHGTSESSITVAVDDGSVTRRYENSLSASDITDEWWGLLDPGSRWGTASIRPGFDPDTARWPIQTPGGCVDGSRGGWRSL